jgi:hypothetical protein
MSFHDDPLVIVYLVVAIGVIIYLVALSLKARQEKPEGQDDAASAQGRGPQHERPGEDLLLQFVQDREGKRYGETVAVEGDQLIVKDGQTFYMAPLASFNKEGDGVLVTGPVDWEQASKDGEAWRERSTKVIEYDESEIPPEDLRED